MFDTQSPASVSTLLRGECIKEHRKTMSRPAISNRCENVMIEQHIVGTVRLHIYSKLKVKEHILLTETLTEANRLSNKIG